MKIQMFLVILQGCQFVVDFGSTDTGDIVVDTAETPDCSAYSFNGSTYDCSTLDRCDFSEENIPAILACCDCDPAFCDPVTVEECPGDTSTP